jgi:hypothetical protein
MKFMVFLIATIGVVMANFEEIKPRIKVAARELLNEMAQTGKIPGPTGPLPEYYPQAQRDAAANQYQKEVKSSGILKYLTEPWKACVFPYVKKSGIDFCE